jgi:hypothetical protein
MICAIKAALKSEKGNQSLRSHHDEMSGIRKQQ